MNDDQPPNVRICTDVLGSVPGSGKGLATRPAHEPPPRHRHRRTWKLCEQCSLWFAVDRAAFDVQRFCSWACKDASAIATGKYRGDRNPRWLGGVSTDNMRYRRRQRERWPERESARRAVYDAIRAGRLVRQPCSRCGATPGHAHHSDYSKPLDVVWLCRKCHGAEHRHR